MATRDSGGVFQRGHGGMEAFCGDGALSQRLDQILQQIGPLLDRDFPEFMRADYAAIVSALSGARPGSATDSELKHLANEFLIFYTKAARLEGELQGIVGDPPSN